MGATTGQSKLWAKVMDRARALFGPRNRFGVFAYGVGRRHRGGHPTRERTLVVYLPFKLAKPRHPVPSLRVLGRTIRPDVVATGAVAIAHVGPVPFDGLHPGAAIVTRAGARGAISALLTNNGSDPTHAITAGHLFAPSSVGGKVQCAASPGSPASDVGELIANFLDDASLDVALIELNPKGQSMVSDLGPPLARMLAANDVWSEPVRAWLPTANSYSNPSVTLGSPLDVLVEAPTRGQYVVRGVVCTEHELTQVGDSGTVLVTGSTNRTAVGSCIGGFGARSVFEPFARAFAACRQIDPQLRIFEP